MSISIWFSSPPSRFFSSNNPYIPNPNHNPQGMLWLGERVNQTLTEGVDRLKKVSFVLPVLAKVTEVTGMTVVTVVTAVPKIM